MVTHIFVARSKVMQAWGSDVGLGKALYAVGLAEDAAAVVAAGFAGCTDWELIDSAPAEGLDAESLDARLARKEKLVDPTYYPRIKGARGIVRVNLTAVENAKRIRLALESGQEPRVVKVAPVDVARHLIRNALA
jgi:hypothetical protein